MKGRASYSAPSKQVRGREANSTGSPLRYTIAGEKFPAWTSSIIRERVRCRWVSSASDSSLAERSPSMEARWHSSSPIMGLIPVSFKYSAFLTGAGAWPMSRENSSRGSPKGFPFSVVWGIKYSLPGNTSRTELIWEDTCLMLSKIVPSSLQKMILLCLPISSTISRLRHRSPRSSRCSISNSMIRSSPGWLTFKIRPVPMCLRSSIQKLGAVRGLVLFLSVR